MSQQQQQQQQLQQQRRRWRSSRRRLLFVVVVSTLFVTVVLLYSFESSWDYLNLNFDIMGSKKKKNKKTNSNNGFTTSNGIIIPNWNPIEIWEQHMNHRSVNMTASETSETSVNNNPIKPFYHFFVHVPKSGGTYFLHQINDIWFSTKEYRQIKLALHSLEINQKKYHHNHTLITYYNKSLFRACAVISNNIKEFHYYSSSTSTKKNNEIEKGDRCTNYCYKLKGIRCDMWISESIYDQQSLTVWPQTQQLQTAQIQIQTTAAEPPHEQQPSSFSHQSSTNQFNHHHQPKEEEQQQQTKNKPMIKPKELPKEQQPKPERTKVYTIIREPTSHILSQYFHCKESTDHEYARDDMASTLDEWIEYWSYQYQQYLNLLSASSDSDDDDSSLVQNNMTNNNDDTIDDIKSLFDNTQQQLKPNSNNKMILDIKYRKLMWKDPKYKCYIPINFQSYVLQFYPNPTELLESGRQQKPNKNSTTKTIGTTNQEGQKKEKDEDDDVLQEVPSSINIIDNLDLDLENDNDNDNNPTSSSINHHIQEINKLIEKFDVIGIQSQMDKSLCLIAIKYIGKVPERCNCTFITSTHDHDDTNNQDQDQQRKLRLNDHGVKHHGDSYNITTKQKELIQSIQQKDILLYKYSQIIFDLQIKQVETFLKIKICDKLLPKYSYYS